jgi:hypothetical protein
MDSEQRWPEKGWRRSLPDLIYNIQGGLVDHHKLALNARPIRDHRYSEKLLLNVRDASTLKGMEWVEKRVYEY